MTDGVVDLPPEGLGVSGVILIGDPGRRTPSRLNLWLTFTVAGIKVQSADGTGSSLLAWSGLDSATCTEQLPLPDGRAATVL